MTRPVNISISEQKRRTEAAESAHARSIEREKDVKDRLLKVETDALAAEIGKTLAEEALATMSRIIAHQNNDRTHPLTCGNDSNHRNLYPVWEDRIVLRCPDCDYRQTFVPPMFRHDPPGGA